jgi:hypothetical protein
MGPPGTGGRPYPPVGSGLAGGGALVQELDVAALRATGHQRPAAHVALGRGSGSRCAALVGGGYRPIRAGRPECARRSMTRSRAARRRTARWSRCRAGRERRQRAGRRPRRGRARRRLGSASRSRSPESRPLIRDQRRVQVQARRHRGRPPRRRAPAARGRHTGAASGIAEAGRSPRSRTRVRRRGTAAGAGSWGNIVVSFRPDAVPSRFVRCYRPGQGRSAPLPWTLVPLAPGIAVQSASMRSCRWARLWLISRETCIWLTPTRRAMVAWVMSR